MFTIKNHLPPIFILSASFLSAGDIPFEDISMDEHNQSWLNPSAWSDDLPPSPENIYFLTDLPDVPSVSIMLTTENGQADSASSNFPGRSLTIPSGTRLQLIQGGTNAASIFDGDGFLTLDGGEIFFAPPAGDNQPFLQVGEIFASFATESTIIQNPAMNRAQIAGILTGPGDLRVTFESPEDSTNRSLVFTEIDSYTGTITVEKGMILDFDTDELFEGGIQLQGSSKLNVDQTLSFPEGALRDPLNGEVPRGLYTGTSLNALGANYQNNGGTIIVLSDDVYVALPVSFSPANPSAGDPVTWNPGQPNEVTGLTFGTDAFTNIQSAIDAVAAENTVFIDEGDYITGSTLLIEKDLTLTGEAQETTRLLREETADPHSILRMENRTVILNDLTITGGNSSLDFNTGGGIDCQGTKLTLNNCVVSDNNCEGQKSGGGIGGINYSLTVNDSTISNNTCAGTTDNGGGIGGRSSTITLTNSTITGNTVTAPTSGGGIGGNGNQITVTDSTISNNTATRGASGGGIGGFNLRVTVNNSVITNNISNSGQSGGGFGGRNSRATVNDSTVSNNTCRGSNSGGGLGGDSTTYSVNSSLITGNTSQAVNSSGGLGGRAVSITVRNSTLSGNNSTRDRSGGAIGGDNIRNITMINCTITDNTATGDESGGGLGGRFNVSATVTATNCIIAGNAATGNSSNPEVRASLTDAGGNIIGIPNGLTISDIILPIANNGGSTQTYSLAENSPAINIGLNNALPSETVSDQRGESFPRIINNLIDSGAVEADTNFIIDPLEDRDGDGLTTLLELALGTEPNAPDFGSEQLPRISQNTEGLPTLSFGRGATPLQNTTIIVERSTSLQAGSFKEVYRFFFDSQTSTIAPDSGIMETLEADQFIITDEIQAEGKAFYRLGVTLLPN